MSCGVRKMIQILNYFEILFVGEMSDVRREGLLVGGKEVQVAFISTGNARIQYQSNR